MARKYPTTTSAIPKGKERPLPKDARVSLLPVLDLLLQHLTPALCEAFALPKSGCAPSRSDSKMPRAAAGSYFNRLFRSARCATRRRSRSRSQTAMATIAEDRA